MVKPLLQWGINGYKVNFERVREILQVDADDKNAVYIEGPFNITRSRKIAKTWWGERWMEFFESDGQSDTLAKGRKLARSGGVLGIKIQPGKASAVVVEDYYHRTEKCRPSIDLPVLTDNEWERVLDEMGSGVRYQAEMLGGQLPESIQDVFENAYVPLFVVPASQGTCIFAWRSMCLHAAALCYVLTELIDNDPFLLFLLRGRGRESLMQTLNGPSEKSTVDSEDAPSLDLSAFWLGGVAEIAHQDKPSLLPRLRFLPKGQSIMEKLRDIYDEAYKQAAFMQEFMAPPDEHTIEPLFERKKAAEYIPSDMVDKARDLSDWTDIFCVECLNIDYAKISRKMIKAVCELNPSPVAKGWARTWGAAIVYALGELNGLFDPDSTPHMEPDRLCELAGVSANTTPNRARKLIKALDAAPGDPRFALPEVLEHSARAWTILVDGVPVDARRAPKNIQEQALQMDLIPHLPRMDDRD